MFSDEPAQARNNHSAGANEDSADEHEKTPEPEIDWCDVAPNAGRRYTGHKAIYPPDSILEDYMDYVRVECESADAFIIGSILLRSPARAQRALSLGFQRQIPKPLFDAGRPGRRSQKQRN
jgi:hypothetical protein